MVLPFTKPNYAALCFLEQIQYFSISSIWSALYALSFSLSQAKHPCFSSPFLTCHDLESTCHAGCFSAHQQKRVSSNLSILFNQNNSIIRPSQGLGKLLKYPKKKTLPDSTRHHSSVRGVSFMSLKFENHWSRKHPLLKFPWLLAKY